jgi:hypothetical protein
MLFSLLWGAVSPSPNPLAAGPSIVACPWPLVQYRSYLPSISGGRLLLHSYTSSVNSITVCIDITTEIISLLCKHIMAVCLSYQQVHISHRMVCVTCFSESESLYNRQSVGQSVSQSVSSSWLRAPFGTHDQILICSQTITVFIRQTLVILQRFCSFWKGKIPLLRCVKCVVLF